MQTLQDRRDRSPLGKAFFLGMAGIQADARDDLVGYFSSASWEAYQFGAYLHGQGVEGRLGLVRGSTADIHVKGQPAPWRLRIVYLGKGTWRIEVV